MAVVHHKGECNEHKTIPISFTIDPAFAVIFALVSDQPRGHHSFFAAFHWLFCKAWKGGKDQVLSYRTSNGFESTRESRIQITGMSALSARQVLIM